jgi:hypothetical protein
LGDLGVDVRILSKFILKEIGYEGLEAGNLFRITGYLDFVHHPAF